MMNKEQFLEGLKEQYEEGDDLKLTFSSKFKEMESWDSLTEMSLITFIEDECNVIITEDELKKLDKVSDLYEYIIQKVN